MKLLKYIFIIFTCCVFACTSKEESAPTPIIPAQKDVAVYLTTRNQTNKLTQKEDLEFDYEISNLVIKLDTLDKKQEIVGFGAALTGSSAYLIRKMAAEGRRKLLESLFSTQNGIAISYLRICIGSSDFSIGNYTYCDQEGIDNFTIPAVDREDLLPVLKEILAINPSLKIMASPWTAPAWMKSNFHLYGGSLIPTSETYTAFSEYFVKYILAFEQEGIRIDAISLQNEPMYATSDYPTMRMTWEEQNNIIKNYLGPKFKQNNIRTKVLIWDHNFDGYQYPLNILNDPETKQYIAGTAFHGYGGNTSAIENIVRAHPDKDVYFTEQSGGAWNTDEPMGNMLYYMKDFLIPSINKGARNFLMWNLALDSQHGPRTTSGGCKDCRGVVTILDNVNFVTNEEYYLIGHFSKFVHPEARRVNYSIEGIRPQHFEVSCFLNKDGSKVVVVLNQAGSNQEFTIRTGDKKFTYRLQDQSAVTFVYK